MTTLPSAGGVGLITGSGRLPMLLATALREQGRRPVYAVAHEGETDPGLAQWVDGLCWVRLGQFKKGMDYLARHGVTEVVLAGGITKTSIWRIRPDAVALKIAARLAHFHDDHLLRAIAGELENRHFRVRGVGEILPQLLAPAGVLGRCQPDAGQWRDLTLGWQAAKTLGQLDIGQGVVVRDGTVLAVEAVEGTDAMIQRAGTLHSGRGGMLVKVAKPQQDQRLDLPTVGCRTLEQLTQARLAGLAVEAGATLILDPREVIRLADRLGLILVGIRPQDGQGNQEATPWAEVSP